MKTEVFYFSGTGNSLYVASSINTHIDNSKLTPIAKVVDQDYEIDDDITDIGFVFPLYYLSLPEIVLRFISQLNIPKDVHIYAVVTRAFPPMGGAIRHLRGLLRGKHRELKMGLYLNMPSNDLILFNTFRKGKNSKMLASANIKIPSIIEVIQRREVKFSFEPFSFLRSVRHNKFLKRLNVTDQNYHVTMKCNGCGICEKICPVNNIVLENMNPVWLHEGKCQECEGCINLCPLKAIEYGTKSRNKSRYFNPDVKIKELMEQNPYYSI